MLGAIVGYLVVRPFVRKAATERRRLKVEQRTARHASQAASQHAGPRPTFTAEELAYLREHTVSPYRRDK